ncbi:MAG: hypothetical protein WBJ84_02370 [Bacteroidales bacterium]
MSNNYLCPSCKGYLNVGKYVVFSVTTAKNRRGLLLLSAELGDYSVISNPEFIVDEGEKTSFYCPICHASLECKRHSNLARVLMIDEKDEVYEVLFSEIAGEKCTFQVERSDVRIFGEHSRLYREFIEVFRTSHPYRNL